MTQLDDLPAPVSDSGLQRVEIAARTSDDRSCILCGTKSLVSTDSLCPACRTWFERTVHDVMLLPEPERGQV